MPIVDEDLGLLTPTREIGSPVRPNFLYPCLNVVHLLKDAKDAQGEHRRDLGKLI